MKTVETRLAALEKRQIGKNQIYALFVEPPQGVKIDNRIVFKTESDIPADYLRQLGDVAIFRGLSPEAV